MVIFSVLCKHWSNETWNIEQFVSDVMARIRSGLMSLWKCPLCTRPTRLVGFYSADSLKQHSVGRHVLHWDTLLPWFWTSQSL